MNNQELIRSLWPLPGGNKHYLDTLNRILQWAASTEDPTREQFYEWLMAEYNVSESTAKSYLSVVTRLGALESRRNGALTVTALGEKVLMAEPEDKARIVVERFMSDYLAFPEVLAVYDEANEAIHLSEMVEALQPSFPRWTSKAQFEYRALWLLSLGALQQENGRNYSITDFGRTVAREHPASVEFPAPPEEAEVAEPETEAKPKPQNEVTRLIAELEEAATDSTQPDHLERAVAEAFEFLGFAVDQLGESGETDVLARADVGPESYSVIIDAKARHTGKLQTLEPYTLQDHLTSNEADYVVVVAGDFATGKVARHAKTSSIVLLPISLLSEWLRMHATTPFNLAEQRVMFTSPGLLSQIPLALKAIADRRKQWSHLLIDMMQLISETYSHGLIESLSSEHLFTMLVTRLEGVRYPKQQVVEAIEFLTHSAVEAALGDAEDGVALAMNRKTLARSLRALADRIERRRAETEA
jgi:predicted transcriptional regulator